MTTTPTAPSSVVDFAPDGPLPSGLTVIEASAGTGKTHALTSLAVRYLAETDISTAQLLVVSFTDATTAELRSRVRSRLVEIVDALERSIAGADDRASTDPVLRVIASAEPEIRLARLRRAVSDLDAAAISTIHGFCSRVLAGRSTDFGSLRTSLSDVDEAVIDHLLAEAVVDPSFEVGFTRLVKAVAKRMSMPTASLFTGDESAAQGTAQQMRVIEMMPRLESMIDEIVAEIRARRRRTGTRTFDSLITDTLDLLRGPYEAEVVHALRDRHRVVLIDEFQDTDHVQWEVFNTAFVASRPDIDLMSTVVIVGDPKQSIYRFRSAELHAYLQAVDAAGEQTTSLRTNWRSDQDLLDALDRLFDGFEFGDPRVGFVPVTAPENRAPSGIDRGSTSPPLQIRFIAGDPSHDHVDTTDARQAVLVDVVATVADLLDGTTRIADESSTETDGRRALERRDIAILTRSNSQAVSIARSLSAVGIAAATASNDSVLDSEAAFQWTILLRALERPGRAGTARAAALGWFFDVAPSDLAAWTDADHSAFHDELHRWVRDLQRGGLPTLLGHIGASGVHERLLGRPSGERDLTDLDHIAELLQAGLGDRRTGAAALLTYLRGLTSGADDDRETKDLLSRRIDRDDDAVRVMTIHKAKGLEFPVVLVPYLWTTSRNDGIHHAVVDDRRQIDLTWVAGAGDSKLNIRLREALADEVAGEAKRLVYVALTRARHRVVVWWASTYTGGSAYTAKGEPAKITSASSALGSLFAHHLGTIPERSAPMRTLEDSGAIEVVDVEPSSSIDRSIADRLVDTAGAEADLGISPYVRAVDTDWRIWSFTALSERSATRRLDALSSTQDETEAMGGSDESPNTDDDSRAESIAEADPPTPLASAPAGTAFGTAVHQILERADFTADPLVDELERHCREVMRYRPLAIEPDQLALGLAHAIRSPLGGPLGGLRLADLWRADRLDEIDFHLPVARSSLGRIGATLAGHLATDDPLRPWSLRLAEGAPGVDDVALAGWMTGSIDLTLRAGTGADRRYVVADYKTNRLGPRSAYEPDRLVAAMEHHDYPLQATLYLVALHRYLRLRVPGYDPDRHLGGAAYAFLRGMEPESPGQGVMWWQPRPAAIIAVDRLLAEGDER